MDTVEWGTVDPNREPESGGVPRRRVLIRIPAVLVVVGFGSLVAAALMPWASVAASGSGSGLGDGTTTASHSVSFGMSDLSIAGLAFELGLVALFALAGLLLAGGEQRRSALWGATVGALGAEVILMAGALQWVSHVYSSGQMGIVNGPGTPDAVFERGAYFAGAGLLLVAAALATHAWLPARTTQLAIPAPREQAPVDQPADLTVTPVPAPQVLPATDTWTQGNLTTRD